jgi:AcrR family transcriptional regulator
MVANDSAPPARRRGRPPSGGREAIVEAALALLRERGIAHLRTRDVAARAGVSEACIYYHFGDRHGLLQAVLEHGMTPLRFVEAELDPAEGDLRRALEISLDSLEAFFDDVLPVLFQAQADAETATALAGWAERHDHGPHRGVAVLAAFLRGAQAAGRVAPEVDPEAVALMVIDTAFGRAARRLLLPHCEPRLPARERTLDLLLSHLTPSA